MKVKYWLPDYGREEGDAFEAEVIDDDFRDDAAWESAAEECADDLWSKHDGWDYDWPVTICLRSRLKKKWNTRYSQRCNRKPNKMMAASCDHRAGCERTRTDHHGSSKEASSQETT